MIDKLSNRFQEVLFKYHADCVNSVQEWTGLVKIKLHPDKIESIINGDKHTRKYTYTLTHVSIMC